MYKCHHLRKEEICRESCSCSIISSLHSCSGAEYSARDSASTNHQHISFSLSLMAASHNSMSLTGGSISFLRQKTLMQSHTGSDTMMFLVVVSGDGDGDGDGDDDGD